MTTTHESSFTDEDKFSASIPARLLAAMAPVIRHCTDYAQSMDAFMGQKPIDLMGTYLLPVGDGAVLMAVDAFRIACVYDPKARTSAPCHLWFPGDLLDRCRVKTMDLADENGQPFTVECAPKPGHVLIFPQFALLSVEGLPPLPEDDEESPREGSLGTWYDRSDGHLIDHTGYRVQRVSDRQLARVMRPLRNLQGAHPHATASVEVNPVFVDDLLTAAQAVGAYPLAMRFHGAKGIELTSITNEAFYAVLMPCRAQDHPVELTWRQALIDLSPAKEEP